MPWIARTPREFPQRRLKTVGRSRPRCGSLGSAFPRRRVRCLIRLPGRSLPQHSLCPGSCFQVHVFLEDDSGSPDLQAVQLEIDVLGGSVPLMPVNPETNSNIGSGRVFLLDAEKDTLANFPWNLANVMTRYPDDVLSGGFDVLHYSAATIPFDVAGLQSTRAEYERCAPAAICANFDPGLALNRVCLGRFNIHDPESQVFVRIGGITGLGAAIDDPLLGVTRLQGAILPVTFPVPEPGSGRISAVMLLVLAMVRSTSGRSRVSGSRASPTTPHRLSAGAI